MLGLFLSCGTQWRCAFNGARTGFDYVGVQMVADKRGVPLDSETFALLQAMESEIVKLDRESHGNEN